MCRSRSIVAALLVDDLLVVAPPVPNIPRDVKEDDAFGLMHARDGGGGDFLAAGGAIDEVGKRLFR